MSADHLVPPPRLTATLDRGAGRAHAADRCSSRPPFVALAARLTRRCPRGGLGGAGRARRWSRWLTAAAAPPPDGWRPARRFAALQPRRGRTGAEGRRRRRDRRVAWGFHEPARGENDETHAASSSADRGGSSRRSAKSPGGDRAPSNAGLLSARPTRHRPRAAGAPRGAHGAPRRSGDDGGARSMSASVVAIVRDRRARRSARAARSAPRARASASSPGRPDATRRTMDWSSGAARSRCREGVAARRRGASPHAPRRRYVDVGAGIREPGRAAVRRAWRCAGASRRR